SIPGAGLQRRSRARRRPPHVPSRLAALASGRRTPLVFLPESCFMPHAISHDARIYWRTDGNPELPALVLGNSLGTDFTLWDTVLERLLRHFYVVRYDMRGHGGSDSPAGDYSLDLLTDDLQ